jgi:hypothetical protein
MDASATKYGLISADELPSSDSEHTHAAPLLTDKKYQRKGK